MKIQSDCLKTLILACFLSTNWQRHIPNPLDVKRCEALPFCICFHVTPLRVPYRRRCSVGKGFHIIGFELVFVLPTSQICCKSGVVHGGTGGLDRMSAQPTGNACLRFQVLSSRYKKWVCTFLGES